MAIDGGAIAISAAATAIVVLGTGTGIILMKRKLRRTKPSNDPVPSDSKVIGEAAFSRSQNVDQVTVSDSSANKGSSTGSKSRDRVSASQSKPEKCHPMAHGTTPLAQNINMRPHLKSEFQDIPLDEEFGACKYFEDTEIVVSKQIMPDNDDMSLGLGSYCSFYDSSICPSTTESYLKLSNNLNIVDEDAGSFMNLSVTDIFSSSHNNLGLANDFMEDDVDLDRARKYREQRGRLK